MKNKINFDPIEKILDKLNITNKNIYLGIDFFALIKILKPRNINYFDTNESLLKFFLKRIGKFGNLIIPVFNFDCIPEKKFNIVKSVGQTGVFGNLLLKKYYYLRTNHPLYSFLCFGENSEKYRKLKNLNGTAKNSIWKFFIEDEFDLVTLGHHYSRSLTHVHYIENLLDVDYRFNLKFPLIYTNQKNVSSKKTYSFFARKREICDFSGMTKQCDKLFLNEKISNFYKYKNSISFKLNIKEASNMFYSDLKKNSEDLISYIRPNKPNHNVLCSYDGSISKIENYYFKKTNMKS